MTTTTHIITSPAQLPDKPLRGFTSESIMREKCSARGWQIKRVWHLLNASMDMWYCEVGK